MTKPVLIIDLEATCWKDRSTELRNEIIEIGCAIVCGDKVTFNESWFVKPKLNQTLSDFCKELTSISQEQVDSALSFPEVLKQACTQIEEFTNAKISELLFVSWGNYDRNQFQSDCALHNVAYPFGEHLNLKQYFSSKFKVKRAGLQSALNTLGLQFQGTHHRGKDDALNIARIYLAVGKPQP